MSVTLSQLRERVRERFEHSSTTRWEDSDIDKSINEALEELSVATNFYEDSATIDFGDGRTYYDLRAIASEVPIKVTHISTADAEWLCPSSVRELGVQEWEKTEGEPDRWFVRGLFWLGLYPKPAADESSGMTVYYSRVHPTLENDSDTLQQLPDSLADCVVDYTLYDLYAQEGETEKALGLWQSYLEGEATLRNLVERRTVLARAGRMAHRA